MTQKTHNRAARRVEICVLLAFGGLMSSAAENYEETLLLVGCGNSNCSMILVYLFRNRIS
jgi:hypothetical protein